MKSLILKDYQVRQALTGSVLVVTPLKVQPVDWHKLDAQTQQRLCPSPFGAIGEQRWVATPHWRGGGETNDQVWDEFTRVTRWKGDVHRIIEDHDLWLDDNGKHILLKKKSAAVMPQWASRMTRTLASLEVKRVQHITEAEARLAGAAHWSDKHLSSDRGLSKWCRKAVSNAMVEGRQRPKTSTVRDAFSLQFESQSKLAWIDNPWCWFARFDAEVK